MAATFLLVLMGALVTNNEAGDSVPDWPLAYGSLIPLGHLQGGVVYEYFHRVMAGTVSVLTVILVAWTIVRERRLSLRLLALAAILGLVAQALLGGLRVRLGETHSYAVATIHAFTAQVFLTLLVALTQTLSPNWRSTTSADAPQSRAPAALAAATALVVLLQTLLGAGYRHRVFGVLPHAATGVLTAVLAVLTWVLTRRQLRSLRGAGTAAWLRGPARFLIAALGAELLVGLTVYILLSLLGGAAGPVAEDARPIAALARPQAAAVIVAVIHLGLGSAVLTSSVVLALRSLRAHAVARAGSWTP